MIPRTPGGFIDTPSSEISEPTPIDDSNEANSHSPETVEEQESSVLFGSLASVASAVTNSVTQAAQSVLPESLGGHHERQDTGNATDEGFDEEEALRLVNVEDKPHGEVQPLEVVSPSGSHPDAGTEMRSLEDAPPAVAEDLQSTARASNAETSVVEASSHEGTASHVPTPGSSDNAAPLAVLEDLRARYPQEPLKVATGEAAVIEDLEDLEDDEPVDAKPTRVQESTNAALARARAILEKRRHASGGSSASVHSDAGRSSPVSAQTD